MRVLLPVWTVLRVQLPIVACLRVPLASLCLSSTAVAFFEVSNHCCEDFVASIHCWALVDCLGEYFGVDLGCTIPFGKLLYLYSSQHFDSLYLKYVHTLR